MLIKLKLPVFGRAAFSYSATLGHLTSLVTGLHLELHLGLPGGSISLLVFNLCAANIRCPGISNLHRHSPLRVPIYTLVKWSLGYSCQIIWQRTAINLFSKYSFKYIFWTILKIFMSDNRKCLGPKKQFSWKFFSFKTLQTSTETQKSNYIIVAFFYSSI